MVSGHAASGALASARCSRPAGETLAESHQDSFTSESCNGGAYKGADGGGDEGAVSNEDLTASEVIRDLTTSEVISDRGESTCMP